MFSGYLKTIKNIHVFDILKSFYKIDSIKEKIEELNKKIIEYENLENLFKSIEFPNMLLNYLKKDKSLINSIYIEEDKIYEINELELEDKIFALEINNPDPLKIETFKIINYEFLSDYEFSFELSFVTCAELKFGMNGYDYYKWEDKNFSNKNIEVFNAKSDGYFVLTELREFEFRVNYNITIDEDTNKEEVFLNLKEQKYFSNEIEEIRAICIDDHFLINKNYQKTRLFKY